MLDFYIYRFLCYIAMCTGLTNSTEFTVKAISDDIAKLVAEYMIHKFGQSAVSSQPQQQQRYISTYNNSNAGKLATTCNKLKSAGKRVTDGKSLIDLPVIYVVTPTYRRSEQIPELTRMAQTLLNVAAIHWIVVEDSTSLSPAVAHLLQRYGIPYTHLNGITVILHSLLNFVTPGMSAVSIILSVDVSVLTSYSQDH